MNVVKSTANKVQELEKRLDNMLVSSGLKVSEIKRDFGVQQMAELEEFDLMTLKGGAGEESVVIQGEIRARVNDSCNIRVTLILDGYEIYSRIATYEIGVHSINIIRAITLALGVEQKLVLRLERLGGGASELATFNFFVWGQGESSSLTESSVEPKLSGATDGTNYAIFLVSGGVGFSHYSIGFPDGLTGDDFTKIGHMAAIEPVYLPVEGGTKLVEFLVTTSGDLAILEGETNEVPDSFDTVIDSGVSAVSATIEQVSGQAVVVYTKGSGVYYFTYDGETRSECMCIKEFPEVLKEVALIKNSVDKTFLVVGLESGKNYLFLSATTLAGVNKSAVVKATLSLEVDG